MVGLLIAGHASLAQDMLRTAEMIMGPLEKCEALAVEPGDDRSTIQGKFAKAIDRVSTEDGVLLLSDIFGGTACNIACGLLERHKLRVVTGVNLPMILEMAAHRRMRDLNGLAALAERTGKKSIMRADGSGCRQAGPS